jgi:hypothetical protein
MITKRFGVDIYVEKFESSAYYAYLDRDVRTLYVRLGRLEFWISRLIGKNGRKNVSESVRTCSPHNNADVGQHSSGAEENGYSSRSNQEARDRPN